MKKLLLFSLLSYFGWAAQAQFEVAITSFEEVTIETGVNDGQYIDTGDPTVAHDLINNDGQTPVNAAGTGPFPLGYSASYVPYDTPGDGLTDGDFVGITNFTGTVGAYTDGTQGYQFSDADGNMILTFDELELGGIGDIVVSMDVFIQDTGWEYTDGANNSSNDVIRIYARNAVTDEEIDILNTNGFDIDELGIEGSWISLNASLWDAQNAVLIIEFRSNSGSEAMFVDNILVTADSFIGVDEFNDKGFTIYPNPAQGGLLYISSATNQTKEVKVYNMLGQIVLEDQIVNTLLDITTLKAGVYMVQVTEDGFTSTEKLVVR